jgi:hypothetical protein
LLAIVAPPEIVKPTQIMLHRTMMRHDETNDQAVSQQQYVENSLLCVRNGHSPATEANLSSTLVRYSWPKGCCQDPIDVEPGPRTNTMDNYIAEISNIDSNSWILMCMMCVWGVVLVKMMVGSWAFGMASYPVLIYSSLAVNNVMGKFGFTTTLEKAAAVAFATGIGMTCAVVSLIALFYLAGSLYQPKAPERLDLPRSSRNQ